MSKMEEVLREKVYAVIFWDTLYTFRTIYILSRERSLKSRVMSFVFPGFNLTNDQEGDADQDIYWRELGWCGLCSEKVCVCVFFFVVV